ncbi:MAG: adenylate cyclase, partial [Enterovirga sp.]|nr:adenylate cyclase [Enterovirga sp.]
GFAILGEIGDRLHGKAVFTAIGDPVNVAARLQGLTKGLGVEAVVSDAVFEAAGAKPDLPRQEVAISGREEKLWVRPMAQAGQRWRESAVEAA